MSYSIFLYLYHFIYFYIKLNNMRDIKNYIRFKKAVDIYKICDKLYNY
jgi:hypothetical protein